MGPMSHGLRLPLLLGKRCPAPKILSISVLSFLLTQLKKDYFLGVTKIPFSLKSAENLKLAEVVYIHYNHPLIFFCQIFFLKLLSYYIEWLSLELSADSRLQNCTASLFHLV